MPTTTDDRAARLSGVGSTRNRPARVARLVTAGLASTAVVGITAALARSAPGEASAPVTEDPGPLVSTPVVTALDTTPATPASDPPGAPPSEIYLPVPPPSVVPQAAPVTAPRHTSTNRATPAPAPAPVATPAPAPAPPPAPAATTGGSH